MNSEDKCFDCREKERRKINGVLIGILLVLGAILVFMVFKSFAVREPVQVMYEAQLYGFTTTGVPVIQDETGKLWEAEWMKDKITLSDNVLIKVNTGAKYRDSRDDTIERTWIEVGNGDGD